MERILVEINAMTGVVGSFLCDEEGRLIAKAMPDDYDRDKLDLVGRTAAQTLAGLWMARQQQVGDIDLVFADGRLIVKGLERACLGILCGPRLNLPLLNLTAAVAVKKLQKEISSGAASQPAAPNKVERLKEVAQEILGDRSKKVLDMLSSAKDDNPEGLQAICDEAVRFTGFFMSKGKAEELAHKMRAVVEE